MNTTRRRHSRHSTLAAGGNIPRASRDPGRAAQAWLRGVDRLDLAAFALIAGWLAVMGRVVLVLHPVPLYQVETDLLGEYIPAARDLLLGIVDPARYTSKGGGYPLLLAGASVLTHGDFFLAARALNLVAAAAAVAACYALVRTWLGRPIALAVLAGLLVNTAFVQATVEAGTDLPALAMALGSVACLAAARDPARTRGRLAWLAVAGLLAGAGIVTRSNYAFLPVSAVIILAAQRGRASALAAYTAACVLPVAAWAIASRTLPGFEPVSQNALNMAYEAYGESMRDTFWATASQRFHTLLDVVRFDPLRFAGHLVRNLATRWWRDVTLLLPVWIGLPAVAGMLLGAWRGAVRRAVVAHFALAYVTLATIFYLPRFSLFLVPFYLSGAAWIVLSWSDPARGSPAAGRRESIPARGALALLWVALLVPGGWFAATAERDRLAAAPLETRAAGEALASLGADAPAVMAGKPHVAYFSGLRYVPLPPVTSYAELVYAARRDGAGYLFFSAPELARCPQFLALFDPGGPLPGLELLDRRAGPDGVEAHDYALYRFTDEPFDPEALGRAGVEAARHYAARHPADVLAQTTFADQLIQAHRPREAMAPLSIAERIDASSAPVARFQALALLAAGSTDSAGIAIERAAASGQATSWDFSLLGRIRLQQRRAGEARAAFARALALDPARAELRHELARAESLERQEVMAAPDARAGVGQRPRAGRPGTPEGLGIRPRSQ